MSSSRIGLRFLHASRRPQLNTQQFRQTISHRWQATDATAVPAQGLFQRLYNSPVGLKTVHFWAPMMKWGVALAGIVDFTRPAEKLSLQQNAALTCTGFIWTRWCLIIKPKNPFLASINFVLGCVGLIQVIRISNYRLSLEGKPTSDLVVDAAKDGAAKAKALVQ